MKKSQYTEEQTIGILKQHEAGVKTADLCREHGISAATFYGWKSKFGGMEVSEAQRLKAMDFFTVPTLTFGMIHCFFVISHDRRRILHCNVTGHPTSAWVTQQLLEAFPYDPTAKYLIFDRVANFNPEVVSTVKSFGIEPKRTSFRSPWQNAVAKRFVGNCRRDLLDM